MSGDERDRAQVERFVKVARESGADESEEHFKARLRKIAKAKVTSEPPPEPPAEEGEGDEPSS
jgi:hypothetical protein